MKMLAHLKDENGMRKEQTLKDHCEQTARYAGTCLEGTGLENTAYIAGLLHDAGKAKQNFLQYLEDGYAGKPVKRGSVNHTFAGVIYILEKYHGGEADQWNCLTSEIISCGIGGHHALFDCVDMDGGNGFLHRLKKDRNEIDYEESMQNYFAEVAEESVIEELFQNSVEEIKAVFQKIRIEWNGDADKVWFQIGLTARLIQSAVIYGDRRDTREFMNGVDQNEESIPDWETQRKFLEKELEKMPSDSALNQVRASISNQCCDAAEKPCGIYRLNVPTGGGKTLASLRYALNHAEKYRKKRIIFIIPLLSVLDQNVQVIRNNISDQHMVLECHSNVVREKENEEELDPYETLMEDWHAPIIVSTLVQFLNILFDDRTSAVMRMQAFCDSVIVIDEVQSLPIKTVALFNMALNFLSSCCNATIILSSATQPDLERLEWPIHLAKDPDMVQLSKKDLKVFQRAEIIDKTTPYGMSWDECTEFLKERILEHSSVLLICNTKKEARVLFERMQKLAMEGWQIFHLSTSICKEHRMDTLSDVLEQLKELQDGWTLQSNGVKPCSSETEDPGLQRKVICISTQLVEAGVDFSFECVIRILAGIDNLAQAAGRCNRSNEYGALGKVYLINLKEENLNMLKEISRAQDSTRKLLTVCPNLKNDALIGDEAAEKYYDTLFYSMKEEIKYPFKECGETLYMVDFLANRHAFASQNKENAKYVLKQPFKSMGNIFQVFDDDTVDILVPYQKGEDLINQILDLDKRPFDPKVLKNVLEEAKSYTISVFRYQKEKLESAGLLISACEGRILILDKSAYHDAYGLGDIAEPTVEHFFA